MTKLIKISWQKLYTKLNVINAAKYTLDKRKIAQTPASLNLHNPKTVLSQHALKHSHTFSFDNTKVGTRKINTQKTSATQIQHQKYHRHISTTTNSLSYFILILHDVMMYPRIPFNLCIAECKSYESMSDFRLLSLHIYAYPEKHLPMAN